MLHRSRIACLRIPKFQIVAHQKDEPALKGKPLIIVKGSSSRSQVLICSKEAAKERVYPGMKLSEARAVCADLIWREYDTALYQAVQKDLLHKLVSVSPKVSAMEPGVFLLDASGMTHLGGEQKFCRRVQKLVSVAGFPDVHTGVADSAFAALVASKFKKDKHFIVPIAQSRQFLSSLSVTHLPAEFTLKDTLLSLGIKTLGQLLAMRVEEVIERFGPEGLRAYELACGADTRFPESVLPEQEFQCVIELGFPVQALQQTQFILKSMLTRLCDELKEHSLNCNVLSIAFFNDDEKFDERTIKLIRPSNSSVFLLELIKLSLESRKLTREFTGIKIHIDRFAPEEWKQNKVGVKKSSAAKAALISELLPVEQMADRPSAPVLMMFDRDAIYSDELPSSSLVNDAVDEVIDDAALGVGTPFTARDNSRIAVSRELAASDSIESDFPSQSAARDKAPIVVGLTTKLDDVQAPVAAQPKEILSQTASESTLIPAPAVEANIDESGGKAKKTPAKRKSAPKRTSKKGAQQQLEITSLIIENVTSLSADASVLAASNPPGSTVHMSLYNDCPKPLSAVASSRTLLESKEPAPSGSESQVSLESKWPAPSESESRIFGAPSDDGSSSLPDLQSATSSVLQTASTASASSAPRAAKSRSRNSTKAQLPIDSVEVVAQAPTGRKNSKEFQVEINSEVGATLHEDPGDEHFVIDGDNMDQSEPLALLLQRFVSRLGPNSLVRSVPNDQHLPDAAGAWLPVAEDIPEGTILPLDINFDGGNSPFACGLVLRKSPSPEPVLVEYKGSMPQSITYRGRWYHIRELTEPEKLSGLWWDNPVCKSYYVAFIEAQDRSSQWKRSSSAHGGGALHSPRECEGLIVLLVRDHSNKSWQIEGFFD